MHSLQRDKERREGIPPLKNSHCIPFAISPSFWDFRLTCPLTQHVFQAPVSETWTVQSAMWDPTALTTSISWSEGGLFLFFSVGFLVLLFYLCSYKRRSGSLLWPVKRNTTLTDGSVKHEHLHRLLLELCVPRNQNPSLGEYEFKIKWCGVKALKNLESGNLLRKWIVFPMRNCRW